MLERLISWLLFTHRLTFGIFYYVKYYDIIEKQCEASVKLLWSVVTVSRKLL